MDVKFSGRRISLFDDWAHCISSLKWASQMVKSIYCRTEVLTTTSARFYLQIPKHYKNMFLHTVPKECQQHFPNSCMLSPSCGKLWCFTACLSRTDSLWGGEISLSETGSYLIILTDPRWDYQLGHSSLMICWSADPYPRPSVLWRKQGYTLSAERSVILAPYII